MTLWLCVAAAFLAQWMLPVAAQWFLLQDPAGESLVPFVQVALTLPLAALAIPVGVIADRVDRRRLVIVVQIGVLCVEGVLVLLSWTGLLEAWSLLGLLALLSCGMAATFTPLSAMVPDLVRSKAIPAASAMLVMATNSTRVIGPAVAGLVLAAWGIGVAFSATLPATLLLVCVLARMPAPVVVERADERWLSAAWSGIRFMRHSPQAVKLMLRSFWFATCIMGLLSLLPLLAKERHATSSQLGLVLAAQGVGAVLGALSLPRIARGQPANMVVTVGVSVGVVALGLAAAASNLSVLACAVVLAGWAWTTVLGTVQAEMQLYLPGWVRARGLSLLAVATFSGQALGASVAGWTAREIGTHDMLVIAAVVMLGALCLARVLPLKDLHGVDRSAVPGWSGPEIVVSSVQAERQLRVRVRYDVPDSARPMFIETMARMRLIRLRTGALRWHLLENLEGSGLFYEEFLVSSPQEYAEQARSRMTASDREVESRVEVYAACPRSAEYALSVAVPRLR